MDFKKIDRELAQFSAIVERWKTHPTHRVARIERDMALERLKTLYEVVCFAPMDEGAEEDALQPVSEIAPADRSQEAVIAPAKEVACDLVEQEDLAEQVPSVAEEEVAAAEEEVMVEQEPVAMEAASEEVTAVVSEEVAVASSDEETASEEETAVPEPLVDGINLDDLMALDVEPTEEKQVIEEVSEERTEEFTEEVTEKVTEKDAEELGEEVAEEVAEEQEVEMEVVRPTIDAAPMEEKVAEDEAPIVADDDVVILPDEEVVCVDVAPAEQATEEENPVDVIEEETSAEIAPATELSAEEIAEEQPAEKVAEVEVVAEDEPAVEEVAEEEPVVEEVAEDEPAVVEVAEDEPVVEVVSDEEPLVIDVLDEEGEDDEFTFTIDEVDDGSDAEEAAAVDAPATEETIIQETEHTDAEAPEETDAEELPEDKEDTTEEISEDALADAAEEPEACEQFADNNSEAQSEPEQSVEEEHPAPDAESQEVFHQVNLFGQEEGAKEREERSRRHRHHQRVIMSLYGDDEERTAVAREDDFELTTITDKTSEEQPDAAPDLAMVVATVPRKPIVRKEDARDSEFDFLDIDMSDTDDEDEIRIIEPKRDARKGRGRLDALFEDTDPKHDTDEEEMRSRLRESIGHYGTLAQPEKPAEKPTNSETQEFQNEPEVSAQESKTETPSREAYTAVQPQTAVEQMYAPQPTLADRFAGAAPLSEVLRGDETNQDLEAGLGMNDKFMLVRDLFDNDMATCNHVLHILNQFEDLDDCLIYIAEHYAWNPNSEGAKLLMSLLERKFK